MTIKSREMYRDDAVSKDCHCMTMKICENHDSDDDNVDDDDDDDDDEEEEEEEEDEDD